MPRKIKQLAALVAAACWASCRVRSRPRAGERPTARNLFPKEAPPARREVPPSREVVQYSFAPIVRNAAPAVVNVYVQRRVQTFSSPFANDPFFRQFFGDAFGQPSERIQSSLGSGVIVSPDGIVVTNTHVIRGRGETEIRIALADKREFDAKVLTPGRQDRHRHPEDRAQRPALPDARASRTPTASRWATWCSPSAIPFGVGQTVTSGIVSALARSEVGTSDAQVFIQTDAAINPGNSGGALVDMSGKLVGINTMIFSQSGGSQGIGFAIPSNLVRLYVEGAAEGRKVERPWLGARLETVTRDMAEGLGLDRVAGAVVARVSDGGPAAPAGLQGGRRGAHVDGFEVADARAVQYRLTTRGIGSTVKLDVHPQGRAADSRADARHCPEARARRRAQSRRTASARRRARVEHPAGHGRRTRPRHDGRRGRRVRTRGVDRGAARLSARRRHRRDRRAEGRRASATSKPCSAARQRMWLVAVRRGDKVFNLQVPG